MSTHIKTINRLAAEIRPHPFERYVSVGRREAPIVPVTIVGRWSDGNERHLRRSPWPDLPDAHYSRIMRTVTGWPARRVIGIPDASSSPEMVFETVSILTE